MGTLKPHPLADLFPGLSPEQFNCLKESIQRDGLKDPIWIYKGQILDGRHRYRACLDLGIKPELREYTGNDPALFSIEVNAARRHLSTAQRATMAALYSQNEYNTKTSEETARLFSVSRATLYKAKQVCDYDRQNPGQQLVDELLDGSLKLDSALRAISKPELQQHHAVVGLLPKLQPHELQRLESNIYEDGCRDAIILHHGKVIDGWHRYEICTRLNIPFKTRDFYNPLATDEEIIIYVIDWHMGRKNLSEFERIELHIKKLSDKAVAE